MTDHRSARLFEDVLAEFLQAQEKGEHPDRNEYIARYPDLAEQLRAFFENGDYFAGLAVGLFRESANDDTVTNSPQTDAVGLLRYRILRPHAKGGLGEVVVAEDTKLHREVALKEIRPEHARNADRRGRFLLEAEITGRLEHPGIVPVYSLGQYDDGRPYYAMRFIRGDNLKEAIKRFHYPTGPAKPEPPGKNGASLKPEPPENGLRSASADASSADYASLAFRQLLGRFIDVCNAVAYAHSRGIVHRDLKPANIMLGKYGETLVVDWGLAKPIDRDDVLADMEESVLQPHSAESTLAATRMGAAIGTLPFMSPEQAQGRLDLLGTSSDIYSLGATLYAILANKAPFEGNDPDEVLGKVRRGDFVPPRQVQPGIPAALEAICLKAMALDAKDRYQSALDLAQDIEHWLADEAVSAWPEPVTVKMKRWVRKHQSLVAGIAAAVLVAVIAGSAGAIWYQHEQARQAREIAERQAVEKQRKIVQAERAKYLQSEIETALDKADAIRVKLYQDLRNYQEYHKYMSDMTKWRKALDAATAAFQRAEKLAHSDPQLVKNTQRTKVKRLKDELRKDERHWQFAKRLDRIREQSYALTKKGIDFTIAEPKYAKAFQEYLGIEIKKAAPEQVSLCLRHLPHRLVLLAALDEWARVTKDSLFRSRLFAVTRDVDPDNIRDQIRNPVNWNREVMEKLAKKIPVDKFSPQSLMIVGHILRETGGDGAGFLHAALVHHPQDFWLHFLLGSAVEDLREQVGCYQAAVAIRPQSEIAHFAWGLALGKKGNYDAAIKRFEQALKINANFAPAHNNWGVALAGKSELQEATKHYQLALAIDPQYAEPYFNLGLLLRREGNLHDAIIHYKKAIKIKPNFAEAHCNLGHALRDLGQFAEALKYLQRGHELGSQQPSWRYPSGQWVKQCQQLLAADQKLQQVIDGMAKAHDALEKLKFADLCRRYKKSYARAAHFYSVAFAQQPKLAQHYPHRYNAATCAALADAGKGKDVHTLSVKEKEKWRKQALAWLQADLAFLQKRLRDGNPAVCADVVNKILSQWQSDPNLATIRDETDLAKLPDDEGRLWQKLWSEVEQLQRKARSSSSKKAMSKRGTVTIVKTGEQMHRLRGHKHTVFALVFSPDGRWAYSAAGDWTIRKWDLATGKEVKRFLGHQARVVSLAVSPDGRHLASGGDDLTIRIWDTATGNELRQLPGVTHSAWGIAISPDGRYVLAGSEAEGCRFWEMKTGKMVSHVKRHWANAVAFSPDGRRFLTAGRGGNLTLWDIQTKKMLQHFQGHKSWIRTVAISKDGRYAFSGSGDMWIGDAPEPNDDCTVRVWDMETGKQIHCFRGHKHTVFGLAPCHDNRHVLSGSADGTIRLWDTLARKEVWRAAAATPIMSVAVSHDGRYALSGRPDGVIQLWRLPPSQTTNNASGK